MRRTLLLFSLATVVAAAETNAQNYVYENFNSTSAGSLPASWSSAPASQWKAGAPDDIMPYIGAIGVSGNTASHMKAVGINGNAGASADGAILATPVINLPGSATNAKVVFDKCYFAVYLSSDPNKKEILTLVASTNGGSTWSDVAVITANSQYNWEDTAISIGSFAGQANLKLGFKYQNTSSQLIGAALDNIRIYNQGANDIALLSASPVAGDPQQGYKTVGGQATISGTVFNYGSAPITSYVVKYQQGANPVVSYNVTGANIAPLTTGNFTHGTPYTVPSLGTFPMKVWVELGGDAYHNDDSSSAQVVGVSFMPTKRLVYEEGTGTWCGWCPRGAVGMEEFAEANPGKVAQIAVHNDDPMEIPAYDAFMTQNFIDGFPSLVVDRSVVTDPGPDNVNAVYDAMKNNFGFADVTMGTPSVSGTTLTVPVTVKSALNLSNAKLALVVTESNVKGTGSSWAQTNYYANNQQGPMGGWETKGASVTGVNYHFVARSITPSPGGEASGLPATLTANTNYNATLTATLNSAWKTADLQYIVVLINGDDNTIMNSAFSALPTLQPGLPTAIENIAAGIQKAVLYPNPVNDQVNIELNLTNATKVTFNIVNILGQQVGTPIVKTLSAGQSITDIATSNLAPGVYFMNIETDKGNLQQKFVKK